MPSVKLLRRAELEIFEACEWYEKKRRGLSAHLLKEIRSILAFIADNPNQYAKKYQTELHFAPLHKFPFIVIYWFDDSKDSVFVVSIFHTSRNPKNYKSG